jgi:hypothetical protein
VPPTAYLGLAIYPLILGHTIHVAFRHLFYLFLPVFFAAVFAERSFTGRHCSSIQKRRSGYPLGSPGKPQI